MKFLVITKEYKYIELINQSVLIDFEDRVLNYEIDEDEIKRILMNFCKNKCSIEVEKEYAHLKNVKCFQKSINYANSDYSDSLVMTEICL